MIPQEEEICCQLWGFPHIHFNRGDHQTTYNKRENPPLNINFVNLLESDYQDQLFRFGYQQNEQANIQDKQNQNNVTIIFQNNNQNIDTGSGQSQRQNSENDNYEPDIPIGGRKDVDGQFVFKRANYGIREICKKSGYGKLIDFNGKQSQKSKDYFVILLCYMESSMLKKDPEIFYQLPTLYNEAIKGKVQKVKQKLANASTNKLRIHYKNSLKVYQNAEHILEAYCIRKDPQQAMRLAYGPKIQFSNRLRNAIEKMKILRKNLGLNEYIVKSQTRV